MLSINKDFSQESEQKKFFACTTALQSRVTIKLLTTIITSSLCLAADPRKMGFDVFF
jgi:hypothetical protein